MSTIIVDNRNYRLQMLMTRRGVIQPAVPDGNTAMCPHVVSIIHDIKFPNMQAVGTWKLGTPSSGFPHWKRWGGGIVSRLTFVVLK